MCSLRSILGGAMLVVACFAVAPIASACINDRRSEEFEQDLQENYRPRETVPSESTASGLVLAGMGVGGTLLLGSLGFSVWRNMTSV